MKQFIIRNDHADHIEIDWEEVEQYRALNIVKGPLIVEIRKYDAKQEISYNQMKYIHCDNGPIKLFSQYQGCSTQEAELILKRECGENLFIRELTGSTWFELCELRGKAYYECKSQVCRKLIEPKDIKLVEGKRVCPTCGNSIRVISILSKTELTTKQCNEWIENMYQFLQQYDINVQMPNKDWRSEK